MMYEVIDYHGDNVHVLEIVAHHFEHDTHPDAPPILVTFKDEDDNAVGLVYLSVTTTIRPKLDDKPPTIIRRINKSLASRSENEEGEEGEEI